MRFKKSKKTVAAGKGRVSDSMPVHSNKTEENPAQGTQGDEELMHPGFDSYHRVSKHLIDVYSQTSNNQEDDSAGLKNGPKNKMMSMLKKKRKSKNAKIALNKGSKSSYHTREGLKFDPQEEVKEFLVQPRAYNHVVKDPFGLDVLLHADQIWLEHANPSTATRGMSGSGSLPLYDYQFSVYDDSEQRILFIRPDSFNQFVSGKPKNFAIFSAIGVDICRLHVKTPLCCTTKQVNVEIILRDRKIGSVCLLRTGFRGYDRRGKKIMVMNAPGGAKKRNRFRFCPDDAHGLQPLVEADAEFVLSVISVEEGDEEHIGVIRQNDLDPQKRVRGDPGGFYCIMDEAPPPKTSDTDSAGTGAESASGRARVTDNGRNMLKLNVVVALLILMVHFQPPLSVRTSQDSDSKGSSSKESGPEESKPE